MPLSPARERESFELVGVDRRVIWLLFVPLLLWCIGVAVLSVMQQTQGFVITDALGTALVAFLLGSFVPLLFGTLRGFRARLVMGPERLQLRYAFGLLVVELGVPFTLELGSLFRRKESGVGSQNHEFSVVEEERVGNYVRLASSGRAIIVGLARGTNVRAERGPDGWRRGPKRRRCDISLDRAASAALVERLGRSNLARV